MEQSAKRVKRDVGDSDEFFAAVALVVTRYCGLAIPFYDVSKKCYQFLYLPAFKQFITSIRKMIQIDPVPEGVEKSKFHDVGHAFFLERTPNFFTKTFHKCFLLETRYHGEDPLLEKDLTEHYAGIMKALRRDEPEDVFLLLLYWYNYHYLPDTNHIYSTARSMHYQATLPFPTKTVECFLQYPAMWTRLFIELVAELSRSIATKEQLCLMLKCQKITPHLTGRGAEFTTAFCKPPIWAASRYVRQILWHNMTQTIPVIFACGHRITEDAMTEQFYEGMRIGFLCVYYFEEQHPSECSFIRVYPKLIKNLAQQKSPNDARYYCYGMAPNMLKRFTY